MPSASSFFLHAGLLGHLERQAVRLAGRGEVAALDQRVPEQLEGSRVARLETQGGRGRLSRARHLAEGDLGRGERLERGHGRGLAEEGQAREAQRLGRVPGGEALAAAPGVRVLERRAPVGGVDPFHERAGDRVDRPVPAIVELRALEPGLVGLDHPAAREDDGVGPRRSRESHEGCGQEEPAARAQGSSSTRGESARRRASLPEVRRQAAERGLGRGAAVVDAPAQPVAGAALDDPRAGREAPAPARRSRPSGRSPARRPRAPAG